MDAERQRRVAQNETVFRTINEKLAAGNRGSFEAAEPDEYVCECSSVRCTERIHLTRDEYERVRSDARRFVVVGGHELPEVEDVVDAYGDCLVVEKRGAGATVAERLDPRA